jgi:hypothetical protein
MTPRTVASSVRGCLRSGDAWGWEIARDDLSAADRADVLMGSVCMSTTFRERSAPISAARLLYGGTALPSLGRNCP